MELAVKICGITRVEDALAAVRAGADALGFVFYAKSPRSLTPERAKEIVRELPPFITTVGVFVDEPAETVARILLETGIDRAQFHGSEPPEVVSAFARSIKAARVREQADIDALAGYAGVSAFLLDAYSPHTPGGTGRTFDRLLAVRGVELLGRVILAGGLTPENVAEAVREVRPYGVDVSSGVERAPGVKDHERVRLFVEQAKGA